MTRTIIATASSAAILIVAWLVWSPGEQSENNRIEADPAERGDITRIVSSVSARQRDVLTQFLVEATVLGLPGGILGMAFGRARPGCPPAWATSRY